jgi:Cysteine-rich secretory protein family
MVEWHNIYRMRHGVANVTWNDTLATYAQNYSTYCSQSASNSPYFGENLAFGGFTNPAHYIFLWYSEIQNYNFSNGGFGYHTGHFTQIVWKDSVQIGCGWISDGCTKTLGASYPNYLACEYYPFGNVDGQFAQEVAAPITDSTIPEPRIFDFITLLTVAGDL